jgi:putative oxygen-independent coproporphyrinogen III oxidase
VAGLYLHIPFCKQACHYCDFHFSTSLRLKGDLVAAMLRELELRAPIWAAAPFDTVYFGGGTPSLLDAKELEQLLDAVHKLYGVVTGAEITLEANPDDLTLPKLNELYDAGINRLSIGIQSFRDEDLQSMNRAHNAQEARNCIRLAREIGFRDLTADLIYALPGLTDADWVANVDQLMAMELPHFSAYSLTVEQKTPLEALIRKGKIAAVPDDTASRQFDLLMDMAQAHGYEQYEISNFAKIGHRAVHNSAYWQNKPYLGIGPSAHSFDGEQRWWNVANNPKYVQVVAKGEFPASYEHIDARTAYNEYVLTALRLKEGIDLQTVLQRFGEGVEQELVQALGDCDPDWYQIEQGHIRLTRKGKHFADRMASDLFILGDDFV